MRLSENNYFASNGYLPNPSRRGFTLVEILVTVAIIATLGAIGFGTFLKMSVRAQVKQTEVIINAVSSGMEARSANITLDSSLRSELGIDDGDTFPSGDGSNTSTAVLVEYISGNYDENVKTVLDQIDPESIDGSSYIADVDGSILIVDGFGTPLRYTHENGRGEHNNHDNSFDLESAGPDKDFSTEVDNIILE